MNTYIVAPEGCSWHEVDAMTPLMAYADMCIWFAMDTKIAVIDKATGETHIFSRSNDKNLIAIEHTADGEIERR